MIEELDAIFLISLVRCSKSAKRRSLLMPELNKIGVGFDFELSKTLAVDKTFERNASIFKSHDKLDPGKIKNKVIWIEAVDGDRLNINHNTDYVEGCQLGRDMKRKKITKGEIGCWLSHRKIWLHCRALGYENVLILEDDCEFHQDFIHILNEIKNLDYQILYPYHFHFYFEAMKYKENNSVGIDNKLFEIYNGFSLCETSKVWRTHAYFVNGSETFENLLNQSTVIDAGIDDKMAQMEGLNCYGIVPNLSEIDRENRLENWNNKQLVKQRNLPSTIKR